ncbi:MAG: nucleoside monophosphate kinase [Acidobacteria bacterium]|nr:nucleoside monophosphate kinase [Acidobacteriota bacterium]
MAGRPWPSLLLVWPTGSGKTPLGDELERRGFLGRRCVHFDFGANLRTMAAAPEGANVLTATEFESVRTSLATGALFEDKDMPMIVKIVDRFAQERCLTADSLLVLNGLPRHRRQAEDLAGVVAVERVIRLEAPAAVIRERIRLDPGGDRSARIDDTLEEVEQRLAVFRERTFPLVSYYRERRALIVEIPVTASMTAAEAYQALVKRLARDP